MPTKKTVQSKKPLSFEEKLKLLSEKDKTYLAGFLDRALWGTQSEKQIQKKDDYGQI